MSLSFKLRIVFERGNKTYNLKAFGSVLIFFNNTVWLNQIYSRNFTKSNITNLEANWIEESYLRLKIDFIKVE